MTKLMVTFVDGLSSDKQESEIEIFQSLDGVESVSSFVNEFKQIKLLFELNDPSVVRRIKSIDSVLFVELIQERLAGELGFMQDMKLTVMTGCFHRHDKEIINDMDSGKTLFVIHNKERVPVDLHILEHFDLASGQIVDDSEIEKIDAAYDSEIKQFEMGGKNALN